jgi:hypothetical protein
LRESYTFSYQNNSPSSQLLFFHLAGPLKLFNTAPNSHIITAATISSAIMLAKTISLIAFAALAMAAPQRPDFGRDPNNNGDRTAQMARVEQLRAQGLNCNEAAQGSFVCSDGFGGDW